ncbi:IS66-like element accessory protein TnpA [Sphingomonas sp. Leaf25]|uniref:IS66-like element accessory protein TnpA n=1 Tax=Sphingomonas sp. Leaf25 TaxID=1735692 RepID=UPI0022858406|nr:transposase [Sphingomonas sp. Leaf25]
MSCDDTGTRPVRFEVFTGAGGRREWSDEAKARMVAESHAGLESVSAVARRHGLYPSQLFTWRRDARKAMEAAAPVFVPVIVEPTPNDIVPARPMRRRARHPRGGGMVELEIDGVAVKVGRGADADVIAAVIGALRRAR